MTPGSKPRAMLAALLSVSAAALAGCSAQGSGTALAADKVPGQPVAVQGQSQTLIQAAVGQHISVLLGTIGPGSFDSVPTISSPSVTYRSSAVVGPYVPAGPRQQFEFDAATAGIAVITFHHTRDDGLSRPDVTDTVRVR